MPIPSTIRHTDLMRALQPLYELLGTSSQNIFDETGLTIANGEVRFTVPVAHDADEAGRAPATPATTPAADTLAPHPQGLADVSPVVIGDGAVAEYGWAITVRTEFAKAVS